VRREEVTTTFTPTKAATRLAFVDGDPPSDANNGLDGIVVTPSP
jgi:hypothetical protein